MRIGWRGAYNPHPTSPDGTLKQLIPPSRLLLLSPGPGPPFRLVTDVATSRHSCAPQSHSLLLLLLYFTHILLSLRKHLTCYGISVLSCSPVYISCDAPDTSKMSSIREESMFTNRSATHTRVYLSVTCIDVIYLMCAWRIGWIGYTIFHEIIWRQYKSL